MSGCTKWLQGVAKYDRIAFRKIIELSSLETTHNGYVYYGIGTLYNGQMVDKIGKTYDIEQRTRQHCLRTFSGGYTLGHTISCRDMDEVEKALHYLFMPYVFRWGGKKQSELFVLPLEEIKWLCSLKRLDGGHIVQKCITFCAENYVYG